MIAFSDEDWDSLKYPKEKEAFCRCGIDSTGLEIS